MRPGAAGSFRESVKAQTVFEDRGQVVEGRHLGRPTDSGRVEVALYEACAVDDGPGLERG